MPLCNSLVGSASAILVVLQMLLAGCATAPGGKAAARVDDTGTTELSGAPISDFTLRDLDGKSHSLYAHKGKDVVLINFWELW